MLPSYEEETRYNSDSDSDSVVVVLRVTDGLTDTLHDTGPWTPLLMSCTCIVSITCD